MPQTVTFISREPGREVRRLSIPCGAVVVGHDTVVLANLNYDDFRALDGTDWTHIAWADPSGAGQERAVRQFRLGGADLTCMVLPVGT